MAFFLKPITIKSWLFSLLASAVVWLPMVNQLANGQPTIPDNSLLITTVLADAGLCGLIWLNWALRRRK